MQLCWRWQNTSGNPSHKRQIAKPIELPYTALTSIHVANGQAAFVAASPTEFSSIVTLNLTDHQIQVLKKAIETRVDPAYLSLPETIEFPTENNQTAYAHYFGPSNKDYQPLVGERPILIVKIHGGPTSFSPSSLDWKSQFWTSRGFAFVDVNYGGSTGYGREYRERLRENWGVVDVDDAVNCAQYLVEKG